MKLQEAKFSGRKGVGMDKDTAGTKKWMKLSANYYKNSANYYKNIVDNIKRFPHSGNAYTVAKVLKALDADIANKSDGKGAYS